jgi:hypothetical protein
MKRASSTALIVALLSAEATAGAQNSVDDSSGVAACAAIESAVARLDCFDQLARRALADESADAAPGTGPAPADPAAAEGETSAASGADRAPSVVPERGSRREARAADRAEREVASGVVAVREIQPARIEVTLANGQVWRQTNSDRYDLLVGHEVKIYPSGFGQYFRLSSKELRGFIQVERVR